MMKIFFALSLLVCSTTTTRAFMVPSTITSITLPNQKDSTTRLNLYDTVEEAIAEAQRICAEDPSSHECRVAWDIVEELEAADSHQDYESGVDASQSMDYHAMVGSFDILTRKIDNKMDQLKATAEMMASMGADPSFSEVARLAEEMKQALAYVRSTL